MAKILKSSTFAIESEDFPVAPATGTQQVGHVGEKMKSHRRGMLEPPGQELLVAAAGRALWIWFSSGLLYDGCGKKQKPLEVPARALTRGYVGESEKTRKASSDPDGTAAHSLSQESQPQPQHHHSHYHLPNSSRSGCTTTTIIISTATATTAITTTFTCSLTSTCSTDPSCPNAQLKQLEHEQKHALNTGCGEPNGNAGEREISLKKLGSDVATNPSARVLGGDQQVVDTNLKQTTKKNGKTYEKKSEENHSVDKSDLVVIPNGVVTNNSGCITNGYMGKGAGNGGSGSESGYTIPDKRKARRNSAKDCEKLNLLEDQCTKFCTGRVPRSGR
ncbi:hypothetical protein QTO34_001828 [Cnephaeus nilssonii]|uniref:Uncharacterized protein n=1 Tax=Cnephaeus nilssonii TaxID=3371016 RepID=A0AA40HUL6_CNENI|nr:hypothetical protein QTO34_001828 [Eptesicus nilssonii]